MNAGAGAAMVLLYEMSDIRSVTSPPAVPAKRKYYSIIKRFYPIFRIFRHTI
jgi:hypothetical protein